MNKLLGIVVLGLLWCNVSLAEEIYISCNVGMKDDRSTKKMRTLPKDKYKPIKRFGFQYFKFDNAKSEITIHEQIGSKKPSKVGSIIIDYEGKNFVEFEIKNSENEIDKYKLYSRNLSNKGAWQSFNFRRCLFGASIVHLSPCLIIIIVFGPTWFNLSPLRVKHNVKKSL